jgi:hypothetical protein
MSEFFPELSSADSITLAIAILGAALVAFIRYRRGIEPPVTRRRLMTDFLNASVIYPFLVLVSAVINPNVFNYLKESRLMVSLAGATGLIFVVGELIASASPEKPHAQSGGSSLG